MLCTESSLIVESLVSGKNKELNFWIILNLLMLIYVSWWIYWCCLFLDENEGWRLLLGLRSRNKILLLLGRAALSTLSRTLQQFPARSDSLEQVLPACTVVVWKCRGAGYPASFFYNRFWVKLIVKCVPYHQELPHTESWWCSDHPHISGMGVWEWGGGDPDKC